MIKYKISDAKIRAKFVKPSEDKGGKPERNITIVADLPTGEGDLSNYYTKSETDNLLNDKQDTLTAGDNISISNNVISATDTTYTAADGVKIENGVIKLDPATALTALGYQEMEITVVDNAQVTQSLTVIGKVNQTRKSRTQSGSDFAEDGCPNMTDEEFRAWQEEQNKLIIEGE